MDEPENSPPLSEPPGVPGPATRTRGRAGDSILATTVVFCGDPAAVQEGFAIALGAMGIDPDHPDHFNQRG